MELLVELFAEIKGLFDAEEANEFSSVVLVQKLTREALYNSWNKNDPKDAQEARSCSTRDRPVDHSHSESY